MCDPPLLRSGGSHIISIYSLALFSLFPTISLTRPFTIIVRAAREFWNLITNNAIAYATKIHP